MDSPRPEVVFSVVVPAFNEADGIAVFHRRLAGTMDLVGAWEAIYVNDGSEDATLAMLHALRRADPHVAVINLSRNFGKEIATTAGLDHARGRRCDRDRRRSAGPAGGDPGAWSRRGGKGFDMVYARAGCGTARRGSSAPPRRCSIG